MAVGLDKHRMFAVLLWALRVHPISAAARFSSACRALLFFGPMHVGIPCEPDRIVFECKLAGTSGLHSLTSDRFMGECSTLLHATYDIGQTGR